MELEKNDILEKMNKNEMKGEMLSEILRQYFSCASIFS